MDYPQEVSAAPALQTTKQNNNQSKLEHETSLHVHASLLDQLMTLIGKLVLSRNQLLQSITSSDHRGAEIAERIDLITSELQEAMMLTRMQSIGNVFNKFPRVVFGMPREPIERGIVDRVVPLNQIPREIVKTPAHKGVRR